MTDVNEQDQDKQEQGRARRPLELRKTVETGQVRQSFSHGRSKTVTVEVKKKRTIGPTPPAAAPAPAQAPAAAAPAPQPAPVPAAPQPAAASPAPQPAAAPPQRTVDETRRVPPKAGMVLPQLTDEERAARARALGDSQRVAAEERRRAEDEAQRRADEEARRRAEEEAAVRRAAEEEQRKRQEEEARRRAEEDIRRREAAAAAAQPAPAAEPAATASASPAAAQPAAPVVQKPRPAQPAPAAPAAPARPAAPTRTGPIIYRAGQAARPAGQGAGAPGNRPESRDARPEGRPAGDRDRGDRPQGPRPTGDRGDRPQGARPAGGPGGGPRGPYQGPRPGGPRPEGSSGPRHEGRSDGPRPPRSDAPRHGDAPPPVAIPGAGDDRPRRSLGPNKVAGATAARPAPAKPAGREDKARRSGKLTISKALDEDERVRSLAAFRRARERERRMHMAAMDQEAPKKVVRDVVIPETITVQELAARMAERGVDVIKALMKIGVMATINHTIDADTAELVATEFGHRFRRVTEADVETGLAGDEDADETRVARPPVVAIVGHVDHGKTSLLDALRETDVASGEAGGITQHIGAYQVQLKSGQRISFLDTPGHEAFTAMRARGAKVADVVVLVVAADDSVMPQTVEAIRHAKAANVPLIVAINKVDKPQANPDKVRRELLQHEVVVEQLGGETQCIEVSAKAKTGLDQLEEAILLQAEILDLRANPNRAAEGAVIEAKLDRGRGSVATVLVQRGTLKVGDIFVAGAEWGRVRALVDERGRNLTEAGPATPVEVLGLQGTPEAGDEFVVVENEARAREVAEFRTRRTRDARAVAGARGTLEQMFSKIKAGESKELPIIIKADVQGSLEALIGAAQKLGTDEVAARVLHGAVGAITESDVTLAGASKALIIGFNVRASKQARDLATRDGVDIRYYSIIYNVTDDLKAMLSGMLAPMVRENFLGYAEIREVFNITKVGKVAGCMITEGVVKRGSKVRLLRDNVVVHEGSLSTLKRFKDEVREVKEGFECGMAFENYDNIQKGDVIECFEIEEVARQL
ncbi:MAG: translation initiation factor IF-2 [Alphaproteobacteria bacterium]|jgi:translation initiation factor IF-2|nr:translation initiation factor IF-2 [Alphaproteobacteria bacterium]